MSARLSTRTASAALAVAGLAVAGAAVVASPASAAGEGRTTVLRTALTGAAEVPGPGDPDGSGRAQVRVKGTQVCLEVEVAGIALPATGTHIHLKDPGSQTGGVVVNYTPAVGTDGTLSQCKPASETTVRGLVERPQDYYVNVHTTEFPAGAVRGDLG